MKLRKELLRKYCRWNVDSNIKLASYANVTHSLPLSYILPLPIDSNALSFFLVVSLISYIFSEWQLVVEGTSLNWFSMVMQWSSHFGHRYDIDRYWSVNGFSFWDSRQSLNTTDTGVLHNQSDAIAYKDTSCPTSKLRRKPVGMAGGR